MDDCGSRSKQLEQMLNEYQAHLKLDDPNSEFTEGRMEFLRRNLSAKLYQTYHITSNNYYSSSEWICRVLAICQQLTLVLTKYITFIFSP